MHRLAISGYLEGLRMVTKTGFLFLKFTSGHRRVHRDPYYLQWWAVTSGSSSSTASG
jgi:hypothetical protein